MAETKQNVQFLDMEGLQFYDALIKAKIATDIETNKYDDSELKAQATANENAITLLNGEGEGSIKKQVTDEIATAKAETISVAASDASAKADKALEDAKAYADGLGNNYEPVGAVKALEDGQVTTNKTDIAALKKTVTELDGAIYTPITEAEIDSLFTVAE